MAESPSPSKYNPLGQAEVGPAALLAQACSAFSFLLSTQVYEASWLLCCLRSFLGTPLPNMCLEGASPVKPVTEMLGYTWNLILELLMARWLQSSCQGHSPAMVCPTSWALCWTPWTGFIPRPLSRAFLLLTATNGGKSWMSFHSFSYLKFSFSGSCLSCPFG